MKKQRIYTICLKQLSSLSKSIQSAYAIVEYASLLKLAS